MNAKDHNRLVGIFLLAHGILQIVVMAILSLIYGGLGIALLATARRDEDQIVGAVFIVFIILLVVVSAVLFVPQIIGGWKLLKERPNARTWGIIGSCLAILGFPLGTAAGVYGMWFLFGEEGKRFYLGGNQYNAFPPPPPNNWQNWQ